MLAGLYLSSLSTAVFVWGTRLGLVILLVAFVTHCLATIDAVRQWAFPGFGKWVPVLAIASALAFCVYAPFLLVGSTMAWPGSNGGEWSEGYLVNRWAYQEALPESGDRVWVAKQQGKPAGRIAEVIAKPGQNVEWRGKYLYVNGRTINLVPFNLGEIPKQLGFQVPDGQLLVTSRLDDERVANRWEFVPVGQVEGRAWAKVYPIWDRRILN
jgi:signal peptidase I